MGKRNRTATNEPVPERPVPSSSFELTLEEDGKKYTAVREGLATILFPQTTTKKDKRGNTVEVKAEVFYNPIQQFNRDLSVLAIKAFGDIYFAEKKAKKEASRKREELVGKNAHGKGKRRGAESKNLGEGVVEEGASDETGVNADAVEGEQPESVTVETAKDSENMELDEANLSNESSAPHKGPIPPKFTLLDALSATGLRALRYSLELPFLTATTANDLDPSAAKSIARNVAYNKAHSKSYDPTVLSSEAAMSKIHISLANACHHMYSTLFPPQPGHPQTPGKYEAIDLDPYGTAAPFLDAAVQAVSDGGLLAITCTDAGVWASTGYSEKCFSLYGGMPVKGEWSHEAGLRLILHSISAATGKYGCTIEPLLSLSVDFYARVFVRVRRSPQEVKKLASTTMIVYNCDEGCGAWFEQRLGKCKEEKNKAGTGSFLKFGLSRAPTTGSNCQECGFPMHLAGPMWAGPLHSTKFIEHLLSTLPSADKEIYPTIPRMTGMLQTALQEATIPDHPFFFVPTRLSKVLHCEAPSQAAIRGAIMGLGYKVSRSHCKPCSIKTDAPQRVIWEIMRRWVEKKPVKDPKENTAGYRILHKQDEELKKLEIVFDEKLGREEEKASGVVRYQVNPTANWGPMTKAKAQNFVLNVGTREDERDGEKSGEKGEGEVEEVSEKVEGGADDNSPPLKKTR
ncbi:RNA methyltransferase tRNA(m5U54)methyltransferase [Rhizina undulata]